MLCNGLPVPPKHLAKEEIEYGRVCLYSTHFPDAGWGVLSEYNTEFKGFMDHWLDIVGSSIPPPQEDERAPRLLDHRKLDFLGGEFLRITPEHDKRLQKYAAVYHMVIYDRASKQMLSVLLGGSENNLNGHPGETYEVNPDIGTTHRLTKKVKLLGSKERSKTINVAAIQNLSWVGPALRTIFTAATLAEDVFDTLETDAKIVLVDKPL